MWLPLSLGETLVQPLKNLNKELIPQILNFCRYIAGPCQITTALICGDYALGLYDARTPMQILLVIRGFKPKLMNYMNIFGNRNIIVFAVDMGVFEMDADRGFLGEAVAGGLIFPYTPLINEEYSRFQEVKLKKRLILELLQNIVLDFPELSHEIRIKPEYFMYETMLSRARLYPPMIFTLLNFMKEDSKKQNIESTLQGYLAALKELSEENTVYFSNEYVRISRDFVDKARSLKVRFTSLFKPTQRALFISLLNIFPSIMRFLSPSKEMFLKIQRITKESSKGIYQMEDPQRYLCVPTSRGLVSLSNRMNIEAFARDVLSAGKDAKVKIEAIGGVLNDVYLIKAFTDGEEKKIVAKSFRDWSGFKWFPLTLWTFGTRTFAVLGRSRLERECAINQLLQAKGFAVPKVLHVSHSERLIFMEYVEGENLDKAVKRVANSKSADEVEKELTTIKSVGERFAEVHALDIALGDTKPENIVIRRNGEICMLDFEQASRNGDKVWDIAEFLYYAGHYIPPFVGTRSAELIAKAFITGYLKAGGNVRAVKEAGNPKYTKVFSVFTLPHIMFVMSNICRKTGKQKE